MATSKRLIDKALDNLQFRKGLNLGDMYFGVSNATLENWHNTPQDELPLSLYILLKLLADRKHAKAYIEAFDGAEAFDTEYRREINRWFFDAGIIKMQGVELLGFTYANYRAFVADEFKGKRWRETFLIMVASGDVAFADVVRYEKTHKKIRQKAATQMLTNTPANPMKGY